MHRPPLAPLGSPVCPARNASLPPNPRSTFLSKLSSNFASSTGPPSSLSLQWSFLLLNSCGTFHWQHPRGAKHLACFMHSNTSRELWARQRMQSLTRSAHLALTALWGCPSYRYPKLTHSDFKFRVAREFVLGPEANTQKSHHLNRGLNSLMQTLEHCWGYPGGSF